MNREPKNEERSHPDDINPRLLHDIEGAFSLREKRIKLMKLWSKEADEQDASESKKLKRIKTLRKTLYAAAGTGVLAMATWQLFFAGHDVGKPALDGQMAGIAASGSQVSRAGVDGEADAVTDRTLMETDSMLAACEANIARLQSLPKRSEQEEYDLLVNQADVAQLKWLRIHLLINLGRKDDARKMIVELSRDHSEYKAKGDSLLRELDK